MVDIVSTGELQQLFLQKYGSPETVGWAPRRRFRAGYYLPADAYEALLRRWVVPGSTWIDIGGGHAILPENPALARELVARCARVVAVDPSGNVQRNDFVHERIQSPIETVDTSTRFDLATMRMVVEHVEDPQAFVGAVARLLRPGGTSIVFTVNKWSPVSLVSRALPFRMHHTIKRMFWGGEEKDTFPVRYRMNTRRTLGELFAQQGFEERAFARLDDLSTFGAFRRLGAVELACWRAFRAAGLGYPESCLLGIYTKQHGPQEPRNT